MIRRSSHDSILDTILTTQEVAAELGLSPDAVRALLLALRIRPIVLEGICHWTPRQVCLIRGEP